MRIDRIDVQHSGSALQLHPRMTVLAAATSAARRAVIDVFRTLGGERGLPVSGVLDVNGVRLQIEDRTVDQLLLDLASDPIIRPASAAPAGRSDEGDLRATLRAVAFDREELDRAIDVEREHLDPFAAAALEAAVGRVDALESRRNALRSEHERVAARQRREQEQRSARHAGIVWIEAALATVDAEALASALEQVERSCAPEALTVQRADVAARRSVEETALSAAELALDTALAGVREPQRDPELVRRLEAVRDEIFAGDDRAGIGRVVRDKRRLDDLRAEEATLLDGLGFDTYSDYVMGVPSESAPPVPSTERVAVLRGAVEDARSALERSEAELSSIDADIESTRDELRSALAAAVVHAVQAARPAPGDGTWVSDRWPDHIGAPPTPPEGVDAADDDALTSSIRRWLEWHSLTARWLTSAAALLEAASDDPDDGDNARRAWAALEQEVDVALDGLGTAQERVRLHETASSAIAGLRERQLLLRDRERDLLERIAVEAGNAERSASPARAATEVVLGGPTEEWRVVEALALQRSVSFVGSVPLLIDGLVDDPEQRRAVLDRLDELSDLIQVVVLTDDTSVVDLASTYGDRAAVC